MKVANLEQMIESYAFSHYLANQCKSFQNEAPKFQDEFKCN